MIPAGKMNQDGVKGKAPNGKRQALSEQGISVFFPALAIVGHAQFPRSPARMG
jgi:hypothetical protein